MEILNVFIIWLGSIIGTTLSIVRKEKMMTKKKMTFTDILYRVAFVSIGITLAMSIVLLIQKIFFS